MRFLYKAKTLDGQTVEGKLEALSQQGAVDFLINKGFVILSLKEDKGGGIFSLKIKIGTGVREKDMVLFARQLSVMVGAGLPLVSALDVISKQTTNRSFKDVILNITDNVRGGARLSSALDKYKNIFSSFYINMIRAGETSGKLDEVLTYLADEQEKNYDLISKVKGAMTYPIFILVMVAVVAFGMMTFVVPKLTSILTEAGVALPLPTRILIATSNFSSKYWLIIISAIVVMVFIVRFLIKSTKTGRRVWDKLKLKLPVFGKLFQHIYLTRFSRSLATLLIGGVPLTSSLRIVSDVLGNIVYKDLIDKTVKAVEGGRSISSVFATSPDVPPMLSQIMSIGEQTGQLDSILARMANFYAREVENLLSKLTVLLEPIIIILLGIVVATMVASIILPMYNIGAAIG